MLKKDFCLYMYLAEETHRFLKNIFNQTYYPKGGSLAKMHHALCNQ